MTNSIEIIANSESHYTPIEMYLSIGKVSIFFFIVYIDDDLYQIEERTNDMKSEKGKAFRF